MIDLRYGDGEPDHIPALVSGCPVAGSTLASVPNVSAKHEIYEHSARMNGPVRGLRDLMSKVEG